ncbi:MAG TPA: protein translocase subunit SecD [Actinomycetota bacterium]|nr:protein translocase subunit SecD [Actinomycetota bacterium]
MRGSSRNLWLSVAFIGVLMAGSVGAFVAGIRPVLGLDLEGGVSVVLAAPDGTPKTVMERALENIRNRVDAFGVGEPLLFLSGNTIEVQLPGLARGSIDERSKDQFCLEGDGGSVYRCLPTESEATTEFDATTVNTVVNSVCLSGLSEFDGSPQCFGSRKDADTAIKGITVSKEKGKWCLANTGLATDPCFDSKDEADAALAGIGTAVSQSYCVQGSKGETLSTDTGPACFPDEAQAQQVLSAISVQHETREFCVISSAGKGLGCYLTRDAAEAQLQKTGQERLLQVIGTTARLEEREVLQVIAPGTPEFESTPVTCGTGTEQGTAACSFDALKDQTVVFAGQEGDKFRLGPVEITGDMIKRADAVYGGQNGVAGWRISFTLTSSGAKTFGDVTTRLNGKQLAIVVDNMVISAPTIQEPITGGNGEITGRFTKAEAQDLATQLNSGALPVNLKKEQVETVSPTLGRQSLHQGLVAGVVGLILLALYLLFYYRLLGLVAWLGMSIWAVLALALVSIAGRAFGYALTLAGVAGLVISLGVTADSYIVFFERLKDEVRHGKSPRAAVQPAFKRAYRTIVAADIVTALAAIILYVTAISSVRGFALTLGVATLLDLFVVYFFKRPTVFLIARNDRLVNLHGFGLTSGVAAEPVRGEPVPVAGGSK